MTGPRERSPRRGASVLLVIVLAAGLAGCREGLAPPSSSAIPDRPTTADGDADGPDKSCCRPNDPASPGPSAPVVRAPGRSRPIKIPDVELVDQDGKPVRFYTDLVKGKVVAINFVFTSCKAACPLLGAGFSKLQDRLGERLGRECALISVSVDPAVDRPERLKAWATQYGTRRGWTLVTAGEGGKDQLDTLLKALQVYSPEKTAHSQSVLVVDGDSLEAWTSGRTAGADELLAIVDAALRVRGGRNYFTDTILIDQDGRQFRFYSDLIRDKVVVVHPFFTSCSGSCVTMADTLTKLQDRLGDRLGSRVVLLSLTVDPATDGVERMAEHARRLKARPGWHLLTGRREDLEQVERRLGQYVEAREAHNTTFVVGNEASGLWMKHLDPRDADGLLAKVEQALSDGRDGLPGAE